MRESILTELRQLERDEKVTVLFACESGSRAWGFESTDSDYDVRFIYLRPTERYLTLNRGREVIERPINDQLDISGWDIVKALDLFRRSNPPILEWLQSPIVYAERSSFAHALRGLIGEYCSPIACLYHYLSMATKNRQAVLEGDIVRVKTYFYLLRPLLACLWLERGLGVAPMEFRTLVDTLITDPALLREIDNLLTIKRAGTEPDRCPKNTLFSAFIEEHIGRLSGDGLPPARTRDPAALDRLFLGTLIEVNGETISNRSDLAR